MSEIYLSNLLNQGGCLSCIKCKCNVANCSNTSTDKKINDIFKDFVIDPTRNLDVRKSIQESKLDFDGKKPFYTICNFVNKNCINCKSGRVKYVNFNKSRFAVCYGISKFNTITVGVHIDFKLQILNESKNSFKLIPILLDAHERDLNDGSEIEIGQGTDIETTTTTEVKLEAKAKVEPKYRESRENRDNRDNRSKFKNEKVGSLEDSTEISRDFKPTYDNTKADHEIKPDNEIKDNEIKNTEKETKPTVDTTAPSFEDMWPSLGSPVKSVTSTPKTALSSPSPSPSSIQSPISFSKIANEMKIEKEKEDKERELIAMRFREKEMAKDAISSRELNKEILSLREKISKLEREVQKLNYEKENIFKNKSIYEEMFLNKNSINTAVYDTFMSLKEYQYEWK